MTARTRFTIVVTLATALFAIQTVSAGQDSRPAERQALIGLARVKRDAGDRPLARRYFEDARRLRAFDRDELAEYFWVLAGLDAPAALATGREILAVTPSNRDVRDRMITEAIVVRDERAVVALAADGQRRSPGTALWPRRLAESYLRQGHMEQAAAAYQTAAGAPDAVIQDRIGLALALEGAQQHAKSVTTWDGIPATVRSERQEWELSRLRAIAQSATPAVAAGSLSSWLNDHPDDDATRDLLVDVWMRAGQPDRALAAMPPPNRSSERWIRRRLSLARSAGLPAVAIAAIEELAAKGTATAADRWTLASALIDSREFDRAGSTLRALASPSTGCSDRLFTLVDRIPGEAGTKLMIDLLATPMCDEGPRWLSRGIERAVALSRHSDALVLLARLPHAQQQELPSRRLAGQLRLWTGDARGAISTLEGVVADEPQDTVARIALVDAYRATHQPNAAWRVAAPLLAEPSLGSSRQLSLAELGIEADQPGLALSLLDRVDPSPINALARTSLRGRVLLALGRPSDARAVLSSIAHGDLTPPTALALIDSTMATSGRTAALEVVRKFSGRTIEWRDVIGRRVMLEATAGDAGQSAATLLSLRQLDETAALYAEAETALSLRRPAEALAALARLADDPEMARAVDLESTALAGLGRLREALALVTRLREKHPNSPSFLMREAELTFQVAPTEESLAQLVNVTSRLSGNQQASIALARSLTLLQRYQESIAALGPESSWPSLPEEGRLLVAQDLHALAQPQRALGLLSTADSANAAAQELRAELLAVVEGPGRAVEVFAASARRADSTPQLFLKWAAITESSGTRVTILTDGARRFPAHAGILVALASARRFAGDPSGARLTALQAIDADPRLADAWLTLLDSTEAASDVADVVQRFEATAMTAPDLVISMAERLARFVRSHDDPLVATAIAWLDRTVPTNAASATIRDMARARVFSAARRWNESLSAVDRALAREPQFGPALKLRAELLSWSGEHAEAISAYDIYLATTPTDVEARRQQARVAGWGGSFGEAQRLYDALELAFPDDARIAAEAAAKTAFFDGRWRAAVEAYARWVALEPGNAEARFEHAEALRAAGQISEADAALSALGSSADHRLAVQALDRALVTRRPSASIVAGQKSANGYGGQRLLDLREEGAGFRTTFGHAGRVTFATEATHVRAAAANAAHHGLHVGLAGTTAISRQFGLEARAAIWSFGSGGGTTPDLRVRATWRPADRWIVGVGAEREPLFENLATLENRIAASGGFLDATLEAPSTSASVRVSGQSLSDGNRRTRATLSISQSLSERVRQLRLIGWAESLSYDTSSVNYFSPSRHLRLDVGLEYAHEFRTPRFRGDRQNVWGAGYLIGVDADGTRYHHPSMRLDLEFARGLAITARAGWIRSTVYNETTLFVGLKILPKSQR